MKTQLTQKHWQLLISSISSDDLYFKERQTEKDIKDLDHVSGYDLISLSAPQNGVCSEAARCQWKEEISSWILHSLCKVNISYYIGEKESPKRVC